MKYGVLKQSFTYLCVSVYMVDRGFSHLKKHFQSFIDNN